MTIEILYVPDCPNYLPAVERVQTALQVEHISAEIRHVRVQDAEAAASKGFPGSPTVRVNGVDVEPSARSGASVGLCCRIYTEAGARDGAPSIDLIRRAVRLSATTEGGTCCA